MSDATRGRPIAARFEPLVSGRVLLALCGLLAFALALGTPIAAASKAPTYDHCTRFISELGARGTPHGVLVGLAGFLPTGLFVLGFCALAGRLHGCLPGFMSFSAVGFAYVAAAFFPCEPGCPVSGGPAQQVHNLLGSLEYLGGAAGLAVLSVRCSSLPSWSRAFAVVAAGLVLLSFALMLLPDQAPWRGLWQRFADANLFGWMGGLALWHLTRAFAAAGTPAHHPPKDRSP